MALRGVRLNSLTGIRACAALLVFWHHAAEFGPFGPSAGMVGVSLFYILSGFVLAWVDTEDDTAGRFYMRRVARIAPPYIVAVVIALALQVFTGNFRVTDLAALTMMQSWVPVEAVYFAANPVFWSLSCEVFFYAMFPLLRSLLRRLTVNGVVGVLLASCAASFLIATLGWQLMSPATATWAVVVFPPARLPEFIVGACLGVLVARGWRPSIPLAPTYVIAVVAIAVAAFAPYALSRYSVTLVPFATLVVALAVRDIRGGEDIVNGRPLVKLGIWSYCFYLVHLMVLTVCDRVAEVVGFPPLGGIILGLVLSVVAAWALHVIVERPAEARLRPSRGVRLDGD